MLGKAILFEGGQPIADYSNELIYADGKTVDVDAPQMIRATFNRPLGPGDDITVRANGTGTISIVAKFL